MRILTIVFTALALAGAAPAAPDDTMTVQFSTPVLVGEKVLPAGEVTLHVNHSAGSLMLTARAENSDSAILVVNRLHPAEAPVQPTVILGRHGNMLKLGRVWFANGVGFTAVDAQ